MLEVLRFRLCAKDDSSLSHDDFPKKQSMHI